MTASSRDLTPAEAYRAAAGGLSAAGARGAGKGGAVPGGSDRPAHAAANTPDMDDSIMRGPRSKASGPTGVGDAVAELAKKFRCWC